MNATQDAPSCGTPPSSPVERPDTAFDVLVQCCGNANAAEQFGGDLRRIISAIGTPEAVGVYGDFFNKPTVETLSPLLLIISQFYAQAALNGTNQELLRMVEEFAGTLSAGCARSTFVTPPGLASAVQTLDRALMSKRVGCAFCVQAAGTLPRQVGWYLAYSLAANGRLTAALFKNGERRGDWRRIDESPLRALAGVAPPAPDEPPEDIGRRDFEGGPSTNRPNLPICEEPVMPGPEVPSITEERVEEVPHPDPVPAHFDVPREDLPPGDDSPIAPEGSETDVPAANEPLPMVDVLDDTPEQDNPHLDLPIDAEIPNDDGSESNSSPVLESEIPDETDVQPPVDGAVCQEGLALGDVFVEDLGAADDRLGSSTDQAPAPAAAAGGAKPKPGVEHKGVAPRESQYFFVSAILSLGDSLKEEDQIVPKGELGADAPGGPGDMPDESGQITAKDVPLPSAQSIPGEKVESIIELDLGTPPPAKQEEPEKDQLTSISPCSHVETEFKLPRQRNGNCLLLLGDVMRLCVHESIHTIGKFLSYLQSNDVLNQTGTILTQIMQHGFCVLERRGAWWGSDSTVVFRGDLLLDSVRLDERSRIFGIRDSAKVLVALRTEKLGLDVSKGTGSGKDAKATLYVAKPAPNSGLNFATTEKALLREQRWQLSGKEMSTPLDGDEISALLNIRKGGILNPLFHLCQESQIKIVDGHPHLCCPQVAVEKFLSPEVIPSMGAD
jgi:hypothetical protein